MVINGKEYRMLLTLDAVCALEDAGIKLNDILSGKTDMRTTITLARCLMNATLDKDELTDADLRKHFTPAVLPKIYPEIKAALTAGMKMETQEEAEKERDLVLEEIEREKKPTA